MSRNGRYLVIEGLDGSGKSTQFELLVKKMDGVSVREPGGTKMAEHVRSLIKDKKIKRDPETNIWLFMAARVDLNKNVIIPAQKEGKFVVSDRNWRSTQAYQAAEGADVSSIEQIAHLAMGDNAEPDLIVYLDVPVAECVRRLKKRGDGAADYFDLKGKDFFERVDTNYKKYLKDVPTAIFINGTGTPKQVSTRIWNVVQQQFGLWHVK